MKFIVIPAASAAHSIAWLISLLAALNGASLVAAEVQGGLVIIGGGTVPKPVLQRFLDLAGGVEKARIVVIPMASAEPEASGTGQVSDFQALGASNVVSLQLSKEAAANPEHLKVLNTATGIYFTGGDQTRLAANLVGTPAHRTLLEIYERGAVVGGTSAGAAIMSEMMITGNQRLHPKADDGFATLEATNVETAVGLGFLKNAIIDQHFVARKRQNRLLALVLENPTLVGVGIDEETAVLVTHGSRFEVLGHRTVTIFDGRNANAIKSDPRGNLAGRSVLTHLLVAGDTFELTPSANGKNTAGTASPGVTQ